MNVTELARRVGIHTNVLLEILPEFGFDIGKKAIKVDDRVAQAIMRASKRMKDELERRKKEEAKKRKELERAMRKERGETVHIPDVISVRDFAGRLNLPVTMVIMELMKNGILANLNQNIDRDTATVLAEDMGFVVEQEASVAVATTEEETADALQAALSTQVVEDMTTRPPVVVVMGHVDHGKTKLLDAIRNTNVVATESGGITQHIGAYQIEHTMKGQKGKRRVTFIDTPGHEAFTVMRSRGARIADIAILVVAADDGVMPQTVEAINIIKAAKLPMVVAINKIDKPDANIDKVKTELSQRNILPEEWGGKTPVVPISAKEGKNIDQLLETILLVADVEEQHIRAAAERPAIGTIIESHVDKGEGPVATVLVQAGTLHRGDSLVVNNKVYGTVRAMKNYRGEDVTVAPPSMPVRVLGFKIATEVGDIMDVSKSDTAEKVRKSKGVSTTKTTHSINQPAAETTEDNQPKKTLNLVVKADVLGSLEALLGSIEKFQHDEVAVKVVGKGLGNVTEADVARAESSGAQVIAFRVQMSPMGQAELRNKPTVVVGKFDVIYALLEYIEAELQKLLPAEHIITEHGHAKVLAIFRTDKNAMTIGARVISGKMLKGLRVRVRRSNMIEGEGTIESLQLGQSVEKQIFEGTEFGMRFAGKLRVEVGDILEAYSEEIRKRTIEFKHLHQEK